VARVIVGYARSSTIEQQAGFEAQIRDLKAAGCEKIFAEQVSSIATRAELDRCLEFVREGDVLVATKPDRLARSTENLLGITRELERKSVGLIILSMGGEKLDTRCPTGKLLLTLLGAIATFERELMLERQREGVAKAKAEGKYLGRKPTARAKAADVKRYIDDGWSREATARKLKISVASVYRILAGNKADGRANLLNLTAKGTAE
jgi:DNA invertase Pin-like site-specific DNA recombinase